MMLGSLVALLVLAPPTGFTASLERLEVVKAGVTPPTVTLDPLESRIMVTNARLARRLTSRLCPTAQTTRDGFTLTCTTRRFWAGLVEDAHGLWLDVRELQGIPWEGDAALPNKAWPMSALGITDPCPGRLEATQAECAFASGDLVLAEALYKKARAGPDANFAYLRLGDLALLHGDPETAVHLYAFVPTVGPVGRVARSRLCDLTGSCISKKDSEKVGDTFAVPEPLRAELELAYWRREVFMSREAGIMPAFTKALQFNPEVCHDVVSLCQKMLILGLRARDDGARSAALNGWLAPGIRKGPHELELAQAAGKTAEELGAPTFAATVLASISSKIPKAELPAHLLKVVELYVAGRDPVRAAVILEYAQATLGTATDAQAWKSVKTLLQPGPRRDASLTASREVRRGAQAAPTTAELELSVGLARDLAKAAELRSRAQEPDHE